jgi:hypothetical protein
MFPANTSRTLFYFLSPAPLENLSSVGCASSHLISPCRFFLFANLRTAMLPE